MAITYRTNWMGPINLEWINEHGDIWAGGRIDIRGVPDDPYGLEYALPLMHKEDWGSFSWWLRFHTTTELWTLDELVSTYERNHPPIRWRKE